jgi:hypothetical protein
MQIVGIIKSMNNINLSQKDYQIYLLKSLLWLFLAWSGFVLMQFNFFHAWIAWTLFFSAAAFLITQTKKNKFSMLPSRELLWTSVVLLIMVSFFSFFSTPTIFSGRDQGSFSEAAIRLSQNHKLEFSTPVSESFFKLHESGRALNFPGFYYAESGKLITQFSLAYISWLALFFSLFGLIGFTIANAVLLYVFFFSFYLTLQLFLKTWSTMPAMIFASTSFVFMWFSRMTLSENMALPLLWTAILAFMMMLKSPKMLYYHAFIFSAFLLCFTRIEGLAFLAVFASILFFNKETRNYLKQNSKARIILPAIFFAIFFALNIFNDIYFYKEIIKALLPTLTVPKAKFLGDIQNNVLPNFYLEKILYIYGLLGFIFVGTLAIAINFWKKEFYKLVPFFVALPSFVYLIDDHISPDHPWMLRRFMFSILPVMIFYSGLMLGTWFEKKQHVALKALATIFMLILVAGNLPAFLKYLTFSENKTLLSQTETLSKQFGAHDLVLIDQKATGNGWAMLTGPMSFLYGKNVAYFFNTTDLAKLDTSAFENVYLITPNSQISTYFNSTIGERLTEVDKYSITLNELDTRNEDPNGKVLLPEKKEFLTQGKIFKISKISN